MSREDLSPAIAAASRRTLPAQVELPPSGLYVFESHHAPEFRMEAGSWPFAKICWVPVGRGQLQFDHTELELRRDDFLLVPADHSHRFVDDPAEPLTLVMLCAAAPALNARLSWKACYDRLYGGPPLPQRLRARNRFHLETIRWAFRQMVREQSGARPGWEVQLDGLFAQLLAALWRGTEGAGAQQDPADAAIEGLLEFLDGRFDEPHTLADLAERCGLSPRRFTDRFRARTGSSLVEYLNRKRVAYACERLRETGHIAYACHESGFQDMAYFYRVFKRYTGSTPGAFLAGLGG